jgi:hypothetical protein
LRLPPYITKFTPQSCLCHCAVVCEGQISLRIARELRPGRQPFAVWIASACKIRPVSLHLFGNLVVDLGKLHVLSPCAEEEAQLGIVRSELLSRLGMLELILECGVARGSIFDALRVSRFSDGLSYYLPMANITISLFWLCYTPAE